MKIGLIWAARQRLTTVTVRYERYARGFRALGHDPVTVCVPPAAAGYAEPVAVAPDEAALRDPEFYGGLGLDAAVAVTWLGLPEVLRAVGRVCPRVVSIADSDGRVNARLHPRATLVRSVLQHRGWATRARAAKFWLQRYLSGDGAFDRRVLDSVMHAGLVAVNSPGARANLASLLQRRGLPELAGRVAVIPYPVDDCYLRGGVPADRARRVLAVGRWDDPQKDAPLLAAAVRRVLALDPEVEFDLIGPGGDPHFRPLARRHPQVNYLGRQPAEVVAERLRGCRCLLLSSRWESGPIVANEALCLGCTLVGPAEIPTLAAFCRTGRFGTAARRTAAGLAAAVLTEMQAWDGGERDPLSSSSVWRPRFEPRKVCEQLLLPRDLN